MSKQFQCHPERYYLICEYSKTEIKGVIVFRNFMTHSYIHYLWINCFLEIDQVPFMKM